jgi:hypothetical protein
MARCWKIRALFALFVLLSSPAWAEDELLFRIAPIVWPVPLAEPVRFNAWVLNQSDHDIRIPTDLQSFASPRAFDLLKKVEPIYGKIMHPIVLPKVDSVRLAPGAYYGCVLEHGTQMGGPYEYWFVLSVPKSDANPDLWNGSVASNKQFMAPAFEKLDAK